ESTVGVVRAGDVVWVRNAHRTKLRRFSDWVYDEKNEVAWLPAYDEIKAAQKAAAQRATTTGKVVTPPRRPVELALEQTPAVEGTIFSYDHSTGYVVAMVGGE